MTHVGSKLRFKVPSNVVSTIFSRAEVKFWQIVIEISLFTPALRRYSEISLGVKANGSGRSKTVFPAFTASTNSRFLSMLAPL